MRFLALLVVLGVCVGCGGKTADDNDAGVVVADDGGTTLDTSRAGITAFVKAKSYASWKSEPAIHDSTGPHGGRVKTFVNDTLYAALKNASGPFPEGSVTVKELYGSGDTITGHAVDVKKDGDWTFYEGFVSANYENPYYFRGTGNLCANCHQGGRDMFLTPAASLP